MSKDKKKKKKTEITEQIKFAYKGLLKPIENKSKDIYNFRYTAPSDLDDIAYLYKKIQEIKKETPQDITTIDDSYGIDIEQSLVGYPVTEDDIDSRTMFINEDMKRGMTELSEAREDTVSDKEQALELLKNPDAVSQWKKDNKVSKEELKRRTTRKYIEQTEALQQGKMSGKEYRDFIRTNQPATKFEAEDLPNLFASYTDAVGALKPTFSAKGIVGLTTEIPEGTIVDSRLDIDGYNLYNTWIASIKTPDGNKYGRTAVLKDVKFSVSGKNAVDKTLAVAQGKAEKSPFAVMKGEWQNLSDAEAYSLAETYINNPDYVQVGFNPERHSFFYRKDNMMPVFEAQEVVQIGALVLAKLKKENPVERIGKLRGLKIKSRQDGKPATFNEGGIPMKKDIQAQQLEMFGDVGKMAKKKMPNDPISGNEIPKGSVAEEVRDDIPAQLSEGEFVLPADVVRYHGLEKLMKLRQEAKGGINMMDNMGQMGNSEEATMSDDMPFKPQMAVGGAVPGINVTQPTQQMVKPSIYSAPNIQPVVTPQVAVPTQPTYTAQTIPQYQQQQPTNTAATPSFGGLVGAPFGQLQESTTKKYVNPETGEELYIPFVNGQPIYPIPTGFKEESEIVKEEEKKDPVASQTQTTQVTDSGGGDDGGRQAPQTKEYQIASTMTGKSGLADAFKEIGSFLLSPGIKIGGAVASALSGKSDAQRLLDGVPSYGTPDFPVDDPYATAEDYAGTGLSPINLNEEYAKQAGYASLADMSANLGGITPTFKRGTKPGEVSMDTGYTFNAAGESRADDGTVAYSSFADFVDNMKASVKSGWHGGAGYTKAQYNSLSDKAKENYKNHVSILSSVKGKDITPSYLKTTVKETEVKTILDKDVKKATTSKADSPTITQDPAKEQLNNLARSYGIDPTGKDKAYLDTVIASKRQEERAKAQAANRQTGSGVYSGDNQYSMGDDDNSSVSQGPSGYEGSGFGSSFATASGGFIQRKNLPKANKKKMKQGGLASRR